MTSEKQTRANRRNARKSTGPKTQEGKAAVSQNALKHGLLSQQILLPNEDEASFIQLNERLYSELQPVGELETLLMERIVFASWRLRRVLVVETGIYQEELVSLGLQGGLGLAFIRDANGANAFAKLSRYETALDRGLYKALHELQRLQAARRSEAKVVPPLAVDVDVSGVSKEDL